MKLAISSPAQHKRHMAARRRARTLGEIVACLTGALVVCLFLALLADTYRALCEHALFPTGLAATAVASLGLACILKLAKHLRRRA